MDIEELLMNVDGLDRDVAFDWLKTRKSKRAGILTMTALRRIKSEAMKAGITAADAITEAAENGWIGFKADWIKKSNAQPGFIERHTDRSWADNIV